MHQKDFIHPHLYHQKGWIANNFQVKNTINAALRWKKRNATEINPHRHLSHATFEAQTQPKSSEKPSTAPNGSRAKMQISQNLQKIGANGSKWDELYQMRDSRYSNFRTTINNRKQLLYIKPYTRYQNNSLTIDQKKSQIYKEINNPDLNNFGETFNNHSKFIEYLTEYREPFTSRRPQKKEVNKNTQRKSFNVLKQKLKLRCQPSIYQSKITAIKFQ